MRVVHIIKVTGISGAEKHLLMLLSGLRERGIDAHLILLVEPNNPVDAMVAAAESRQIPVQRVVIHRDYDILLPFRLRNKLRTLKPDIVHTHLLHADLFGIPAARLAGIATIITGRHNDDDFRSQSLLKRINSFLWRMVKGGIAISDAIRDFTIEVEDAPAEKVFTVRYGIEYTPADVDFIRESRASVRQELGMEADAPLPGMVCRLTEQKGVGYGIRTFKRLENDYPTAHLLIAGDGPQRAALLQEVRALHLTDRVHFLGWREDVHRLLAALDVLLVPSLWEGFGLVMLEAMAQRVPIIGSDVSAIPEVIIHGETGFLVPPRQIDPIAAGIRRLLDDRALRLHIGMVAEDRLETHFSASRMVDETIAIYERLHGSR